MQHLSRLLESEYSQMAHQFKAQILISLREV